MNENETQTPPVAIPRIGPRLALVLSMFVMTGLGQILTGRLYRGLLMMGAMLLWLPWALINLGLDMTQVMDQLTEENPGVSPDLAQVLAAMPPLAESSLSLIFFPFIIIWFWTVGDSIGYLIKTRGKKQ